MVMGSGFFFALVFLSHFCFVRGSVLDGGKTKTDCEIFANNVTAILDGLFKSYGVPGAIFGATLGRKEDEKNDEWERNGKDKDENDFLLSFGTSRVGEKTSTNMRFRSGGAYVALMCVLGKILENKGLYNMTAPISQYGLNSVHSSDLIDSWHLCYQRSGFTNYGSDASFLTLRNANVFKNWTTEELLNVIRNKTVVFVPGSNFLFADITPAVLLTAAMENATKTSYPDLMKRHLFDPCNAKNTYVISNVDDVVLPQPVFYGFANERGIAGGALEDSTFWNPSWGGYVTSTVTTMSDSLKIWHEVYSGSLFGKNVTKAKATLTSLTLPINVGSPGNLPNAYYGAGVAVGGLGLDYLIDADYPQSMLWRNQKFNAHQGLVGYVPKHDLTFGYQVNINAASITRPLTTELLSKIPPEYMRTGLKSCIGN